MQKFVIRASVAERPSTDAYKHINPGDIVWLGWTPEGGGWYQWRESVEQAKLFDDPAVGLREGLLAGPWFYKPSPESVEAVKVEYTPARPASVKIIE